MSQQPQHFCTNCGHPLTPGATFCMSCGVRVGVSSAPAPGQVSVGAAPGSPPPSAQDPVQAPDDLVLAGLLASSGMRRRERRALRQAGRGPRQPGARLRGCGCPLLLLALLAGPFIGIVLTTGRLHEVFLYVAGGMVLLVVLLVLIGMLATKRGREALAEGLLEALLEGLFGGG